MDVTELPEKLAIVGGGYIGLEYASMYANFGSQVTVLQVESEFIPREDREIAAEIFMVLSEKIDFRLGAQIRSIREIGNKTRLEWLENGEMRALDADAILIATGRRPATADLHLEKAGVETLPNGAVRTGEPRHKHLFPRRFRLRFVEPNVRKRRVDKNAEACRIRFCAMRSILIRP